MSLKEAREKKNELKYLLSKYGKITHNSNSAESFQNIAEKYLDLRNDLSANTLKKTRARLENYCYKHIGDYLINKITKTDILGIFEKLKILKKSEVADKLFSDIKNIFSYAVNKGLIELNPMLHIDKKHIIYKAPVKHFASIVEPDKIKLLIEDTLHFQGELNTKIATLLSLFTAQRSFSIRSAAWQDFDLEKGIWNIPASKMKMKEARIIHLSDVMIKILKDYQKISDETLLFKSIRSKTEIISDNTIRTMFRRMGYKNEDFTPHGFC